MTKSLSELLTDVIRRYGLEHDLLRERMPVVWADVVGKRIAAISQVTSFENGVLTVRILTPAWRSEVMLRRDELRNQLNTRIGSDVVRELKVK